VQPCVSEKCRILFTTGPISNPIVRLAVHGQRMLKNWMLKITRVYSCRISSLRSKSDDVEGIGSKNVPKMIARSG
jgi:hypothetical protein